MLASLHDKRGKRPFKTAFPALFAVATDELQPLYGRRKVAGARADGNRRSSRNAPVNLRNTF